MNTHYRLGLLLISPLLFPSLVYAKNQSDPFFAMPIVLSASRLEQPASETPIAVSVIDRQTIEASGARTIPEVLRLVPGIIVGNSVNEYGDQPKIVVAYHDHTDQYSKQMQVLIDGRSIYEPAQGGVAWNMLPINIDDIQRIEVSRGPNAASYGSNSFMAVINIITRHAIEDQGQVVKYYYNLLNTTDRPLSKVVNPADFGIPADPFQLNLNFDIKSQRHNLEATDYVQVNDGLRFIWGLSGQEDLVQAPFYLGTNRTIRRETYRGFTNIEWHVSKNNILNFGVLIEKNNTSNTANSPRIAYIHKFNERHSLRFSISKAMRSPFIFEEYANQSLSHELTSGGVPPGIVITDQQVGPPAQKLSDEEIVSRDIGYYGRFFNNDLLFDTRIYRDTLSHLIRLHHNVPYANDTLNGVTDIMINDNSTNVTGLEAEVDYVVDPSLRIIGSTSFTDITSNDPVRNGASEGLVHSAPHSAASMLTIKRFNELYSGSAGYYYVSRFSWIDASAANSNNYQTLDLKLSRKAALNGEKATASLILKNLLGKYSNYDKSPAYGPQIVQDFTTYLEFKIQLNKRMMTIKAQVTAEKQTQG